MTESAEQQALVVDSLGIAEPAGEAAGAVQAGDVEAIHQTDGQAMQGAERTAVLAEVGIQLLGAGGGGVEIQLAQAVGQLVGEGGAVSEGASDLTGRVIATAQGEQQARGGEGGDGPLDGSEEELRASQRCVHVTFLSLSIALQK